MEIKNMLTMLTVGRQDVNSDQTLCTSNRPFEQMTNAIVFLVRFQIKVKQ